MVSSSALETSTNSPRTVQSMRAVPGRDLLTGPERDRTSGHCPNRFRMQARVGDGLGAERRADKTRTAPAGTSTNTDPCDKHPNWPRRQRPRARQRASYSARSWSVDSASTAMPTTANTSSEYCLRLDVKEDERVGGCKREASRPRCPLGTGRGRPAGSTAAPTPLPRRMEMSRRLHSEIPKTCSQSSTQRDEAGRGRSARNQAAWKTVPRSCDRRRCVRLPPHRPIVTFLPRTAMTGARPRL